MRKLLFALPMMLFITACADATKEDIDRITLQVMEITTTACGFAPTAVTVANIFNNTEIKTAVDIANAICNAVTKVGSASDAPKPKVQGVEVNGWRVRK